MTTSCRRSGSAHPDARMPVPAAPFPDMVALDPNIACRRPRRHHLDDFGRHGRNDAANMMARDPHPAVTAPRPMTRNPVVAWTRRRGNDLDTRRRHRTPLDNDGLRCGDADPPA